MSIRPLDKSEVKNEISQNPIIYLGPNFPPSFIERVRTFLNDGAYIAFFRKLFDKDSKNGKFSKGIYDDAYILASLKAIEERTPEEGKVTLLIVSEVAQLLQSKDMESPPLSIQSQRRKVTKIIKNDFPDLEGIVEIKTLNDFPQYQEIMGILRSKNYSEFFITGNTYPDLNSPLGLMQVLVSLAREDQDFFSRMKTIIPQQFLSAEIHQAQSLSLSTIYKKPQLLYPFINLSFKIFDVCQENSDHIAPKRESNIDRVLSNLKAEKYSFKKMKHLNFCLIDIAEKLKVFDFHPRYINTDQNPYKKKLESERIRKNRILFQNLLWGILLSYLPISHAMNERVKQTDLIEYESYINDLYEGHKKDFICYTDMFEISDLNSFSSTVDLYYSLLHSQFIVESNSYSPGSKNEHFIKKLIAGDIFSSFYHISTSDLCSGSISTQRKHIFLYTFALKHELILKDKGFGGLKFLKDKNIELSMKKALTQEVSSTEVLQTTLKSLYHYEDQFGLTYCVNSNEQGDVYAGISNIVEGIEMSYDMTQATTLGGKEEAEKYFLMKGAYENAEIRMNDELRNMLFEGESPLLYTYKTPELDSLYSNRNPFDTNDVFPIGIFQIGGEEYELAYGYGERPLVKILCAKKSGEECFYPAREVLEKILHNEFNFD